MDSTPLVCITGQVYSALAWIRCFPGNRCYWMYHVRNEMELSNYKAEEIPEVFAKAFYVANSGRPGPVLIDITKDAQMGELDFHYKEIPKSEAISRFQSAQVDQIQAAATLINNAKKPLILAGHGIQIADAQEVFKDFVEKTGIPVGMYHSRFVINSIWSSIYMWACWHAWKLWTQLLRRMNAMC